MARLAGDCVLGSRLAIWLLKEADIKVYLRASTEVRVHRIVEREGGDFNAVKAFTEKRDAEDHERYMRIYDIDNDDYSFVDMIIDSGKLGAEEIAGKIAERAQKMLT
jgi:cytidylate kinase